MYDVAVWPGHGAALFDASQLIVFRFHWLLGSDNYAKPDQLAGLAVRGDSMEPTLSHGDHILIDAFPARRNDPDGVCQPFGWIRRSVSAHKLMQAVGALTSSVTTKPATISTTLNARLSKSLAASFGWAGAFNRMCPQAAA